MPEKNKITKVLIVGGGTAGWLAANHLGKRFSDLDGPNIEVTLIESPNIPNIGVGEGTVPMMRETLRYLGIDEGYFVQSCDATFKQSIKFVDWVYNPKEKNHSYHHLFDYPMSHDSAFYWHKTSASSRDSFANSVSVQSVLADAGLGPKLVTQPQFQGVTSYAYHLDARKFSEVLRLNALSKFGLSHILDDVLEVTLSDSGDISTVSTSQNGELEADLFIDCTGFSARLIEKACKVPFVDKGDVLFVDSALAVQVPYEKSHDAIPCFTLSTAKEAGWIWDIGLTERRGVGYVYSSRHSSRQDAEKVLSEYLGGKVSEAEFRHIPMRIGYREKAWHRNCVAIGLSGGFVEPLEATGLLVFDVTSRMLAECIPNKLSSMHLVAERFNQRTVDTWNKVIDFIKLHYVASKRNDTEFWSDNRKEASIPDSLKQKLALWSSELPNRYDFTSTLEIFNLENYQYVLYGMDFDTDLGYSEVSKDGLDKFLSEQNKIAEFIHQAKTQLEPHRELIEKIHKFGIQKV
ncbi:2-polyprenyl-6-methoxyphenol hydroxylase-like oxidoreductase [Shewanella psychrophila]|uniref:2-polyprenyl-6-methoxyphenol hydroxylase-like oxidoreductase n=1 Tax=Shewanella psychrophila TaxID=225848 RepID=A0A1S6HPV0_9GAMM|nr:tryptophan halogenase family protein [Shewanella psychrophila]AQS37524.1 2-polyprenyl-6-methoxyphenol hydroxylase-like oxidoreductase [Shewanella psychrophila]